MNKSHEPYTMAFKELIFTKLDLHRKEFLDVNNIGPDEIITVKVNGDDILTSFRFKNNEFIWSILKNEMSSALTCSSLEAEENLILSGGIDSIVKYSLLIAGNLDYSALYVNSWHNG